MTIDGTAIGCVGNISFSLRSGEIESVEASNGTTAKYLLGTLEVPADYIKGFKRGMGVDLVVKEDSREAGRAGTVQGRDRCFRRCMGAFPRRRLGRICRRIHCKGARSHARSRRKSQAEGPRGDACGGRGHKRRGLCCRPAGCRKQGDGSHPSRKNTKKPVSERSPESSLRARPMIPRKTRKGTLSSIATLTALNSMLKTCRSTMFSTKDDRAAEGEEKTSAGVEGFFRFGHVCRIQRGIQQGTI